MVIEENIPNGSGPSLFVRTWRPEGMTRALVVIVHGLNAHGGLYAWAAGRLTANGYAVVAPDLRGRGRSAGERFMVGNIEAYVSDVGAAIGHARKLEPGAPMFLLGHSAGGVVACLYALDHQEELSGLVCESFAYLVPAPAFVLAIIRVVAHALPRLPVLHLRNSDFSRDPEIVEALDSDPLILNETQPAATVAALARANQRLSKEMGRLELPVLILHGEADKVTLPAGSRDFFDRAGATDKTLRLYRGAAHDLLADVERESVMRDVTEWIDRQLTEISKEDRP